MTPKKRARITEDVLRQARERCQQEIPKIHADLVAYWVDGDPESKKADSRFTRVITLMLIGLTLLDIILVGLCFLLDWAGGGV